MKLLWANRLPIRTTRTHPVKKESGRHLADIGIDEDIGVELKLNLRSKAQMDRLEGQASKWLSVQAKLR